MFRLNEPDAGAQSDDAEDIGKHLPTRVEP